MSLLKSYSPNITKLHSPKVFACRGFCLQSSLCHSWKIISRIVLYILPIGSSGHTALLYFWFHFLAYSCCCSPFCSLFFFFCHGQWLVCQITVAGPMLIHQLEPATSLLGTQAPLHDHLCSIQQSILQEVRELSKS